MRKNNPFIQNLRNTYEESIKQIDENIYELIKSDSNMAAIIKFGGLLTNVRSVYETSKYFYTLIYMSRSVLEHFGSSKARIKYIPLISFFNEDIAIDSTVHDRYINLINENYDKFLNKDNEFQLDDYREFFVIKLLNEAGYNKNHWYFKLSYINELEFMLDFLLSFIEEDFNPIIEDSEDNNNKDRSIPKDVKISVWRRDLGKCVECGSNEKLEYDHIIPVSKGGSNTERNVQLLCEKCNRGKSDSIQ